MHTLLFQAIKLEKILHDRNAEIDALKSRLTSEMSCTEEGEVMNTPPPKVYILSTPYYLKHFNPSLFRYRLLLSLISPLSSSKQSNF